MPWAMRWAYQRGEFDYDVADTHSACSFVPRLEARPAISRDSSLSGWLARWLETFARPLAGRGCAAARPLPIRPSHGGARGRRDKTHRADSSANLRGPASVPSGTGSLSAAARRQAASPGRLPPASCWPACSMPCATSHVCSLSARPPGRRPHDLPRPTGSA